MLVRIDKDLHFSITLHRLLPSSPLLGFRSILSMGHFQFQSKTHLNMLE